MAVEVNTDPNFEASAPEVLFVPALTASQTLPGFGHQYAVSADGQRILVNARVEPASSPITVVINWTADLENQ